MPADGATPEHQTPEWPAREWLTLEWWVGELVGALDREPASAIRLRQVAGRRRARVSLDDETVVVSFDGQGQLVIQADQHGPHLAGHQWTSDHPAGDDPAGDDPAGDDLTGEVLAGEGATTRADVRAILAGRLDASQAVLSGRIVVRGPTAAVGAMLHAIELLLDAAGRLPALRALSDDLMREASAAERAQDGQAVERAGRELEVLSDLDLLP